MSIVTRLDKAAAKLLDSHKFIDPDRTAKGERRAAVGLERLDTLWLNTGTLCNITCRNCYIESTPTNDRLAYMAPDDVAPFLEEIEALGLGTREIGFTGGEPFMNPDIVRLMEMALERGHRALVLTNAMAPMMRPRVQTGLLDLKARFGSALVLRVSLDHYTDVMHDDERGPGAFALALKGLEWLSVNGFALNVAGRTCWTETEPHARDGYRALFAEHGFPIDADDPSALMLFPEMDEHVDVPEITEGCWSILHKSPAEMMCASSRMIVKRKGEAAAKVLPCTLLPYDPRFEMGTSLAQSLHADGGMFRGGAVKLNHPHCAKFCVLGGGSCSAKP